MIKLKLAILLVSILAINSNAQDGEEVFHTLKFDFGEGRVIPGYIKVTPDCGFSDSSSFGFLKASDLRAIGRSGRKGRNADYITSSDPFIFLSRVPEGNYNVKITAAGIKADSWLSIKSESRRLMAAKVHIPRREVRTIEFTCNVRYPELKSGKKVRLKSREIGHFNWDRNLSIEFSGSNIAVSSLEISRNDSAVTVFLAGNSTVCDQRYEPYSAWGQMLPGFFKPGVISVANHAESGEALKSFVAEHRFEKLLDQIRPGDFLFIQFAHNDQKKQSSAYAAPFTDYQEYLRLYIREVKNLGATPVLITPMLRRSFDDQGKVLNTHGKYPEAMRQVAAEEGVTLIDLFEMSKILYEALGPDDSKKLFVHYPAGSFPGQEKELKDNSHHSSYGAYALARCIVNGIYDKQPELAEALVGYSGRYDPAHPDPFDSWSLPASPAFNLLSPEGR